MFAVLMKKILLILALGSTLFGLQNCRKDFYDNITDDALLGEWDSTFYHELAQAPTDTTTKISTVKLDNGTSVLDFLKTYDPNFLTQQNITPRRRLVQTPEEQRNLLIARMIAKGLDLCDKIKWKGLYPAQPNGLAYVWGGKDHTTPTLPLSPHKCPDKLHGVDCSGLVFQAAKSAGLTFNKGNCDCIYLRDTSNWNNIFRKHPEYKNLIAVPYKQGPTFNEDSLRPGDIIFKSCFGTKCTKPYVHVGIYAAGPYQQDWCIVIQSDGDKNGNCEKAKNTGPRVIQWNKDSAFGRSTTKYGKDWEVVRIETNCRVPADPISIKKIGDNQKGVPNDWLKDALGLSITDKMNQGCECMTIYWKVLEGNGKLQYDSTKTNAEGSTTNTWRIGSSGIQRIEAKVKNANGKEVQGSPLIFTAELDTIDILKRLEANMVSITGGTFTMGCTAEQVNSCDTSNEIPAHSVTLNGFKIGKYEVTQEEWTAVMGSNPSYFSNCAKCPVEYVSWNDIQTFLQKLNTRTGGKYRLPTEAEWEYAARGGNKSAGFKYSGSNSLSSVAWYEDNSSLKTHIVGQKAANELGLYDMSGNACEWCSDWYDEDYYSISPSSNPGGPVLGDFRVLRGGGWTANAEGCRVSNRIRGAPDHRYGDGGFRLVSPGL